MLSDESDTLKASTKPSKKEELKGLTSLRWFCAFYIFLFHVQIRVPLVTGRRLANLFNQGAIGMSFFFLLSGFVLAYASYGSVVTPTAFFLRRFARIYPAYIAALALGFIVVGYKLSGAQAFFNAFANLFSLQGWFPHLFQFGINGGTWSLTVEWFFYFMFPFFFPLMAVASRRTLVFALVGFWAMASVIGAGYFVFRHEFTNNMFYTVPVYRFPEFLVGVVLGTLFARNELRFKANGLLAACATQILMFLYLSNQGEGGYVQHNWIVVICLSTLIVAVASGSPGNFLENRFLVWLGEISYGFYLFQFISLTYIVQLTQGTDRLQLYLTVLALLVGTVLMAAISYYLIERPARMWISKFARSHVRGHL